MIHRGQLSTGNPQSFTDILTAGSGKINIMCGFSAYETVWGCPYQSQNQQLVTRETFTSKSPVVMGASIKERSEPGGVTTGQ